jgi:hypothetical protein
MLGNACPADPSNPWPPAPHEPEPGTDDYRFLGNRWFRIRICRRCGALYAECQATPPPPTMD